MFDLCKNCYEQGLITDFKEGTVVCRFCGTISVNRIIDDTAEWRNFAKDSSAQGGDDPKRVGQANNDLLHDRGICTMISGFNSKDNSLARWNQRLTESNSDKILLSGFQKISDTSNSLGLPDSVTEEARYIFKELEDKKIVKGKSRNATTGACIFLACRKKNNPRSIREISNHLGVDKKEILKCYSTIKRLLPMKYSDKSVSDYAIRYANELSMTSQQVGYVQKVAEKVSELGIVTGKNPSTVASAVVYFIGQVSTEPRTYSEISDVSLIKDLTIKKCFKELKEKEKVLLGDNLPLGWKREIIFKAKV